MASSATSVSGSLTANGTTFTNQCGGNSYITFTSTATLSGGTNTFNLPIIVPYTLVPSLAGNTSFDEVEIQAGTISSGTLSLNLLGTITTNFFYEFPNGFTVAAGGTIAVGANVPITVVSTLSDAGNGDLHQRRPGDICLFGDFRQRQPDRQRHQLHQRRRRLVHHIHFDRNPQWRHQHLQLADHRSLHPGPLARGQYQLQ